MTEAPEVFVAPEEQENPEVRTDEGEMSPWNSN